MISLFLWILCFQGPSPQEVVDLELSLVQSEKTEKLKTLLTLSDYYRTRNMAKSIHFANRSLDLAKELEDVSATILALNHRSNAKIRQSDYVAGEKDWQEAMALARKHGDKSGIAYAHDNHGTILFYKDQYQEALSYFLRSLEIHKKLRNPAGHAESLNLVGLATWRLGKQYDALKYFKQSRDLFLKLGYGQKVAKTANNLGLIYSSIGQSERALQAYYEALENFEANDQHEYVATVLVNLGELYSETGRFEDALLAYKRCLEIDTKLGARRNIAMDHLNMGLQYTDLNQLEPALRHLGKSKELLEDLGGVLLAKAAVGLAEAWLKKGMPNKAKEFAVEALQIYENFQAPDAECEALYIMGEACVELGQYQKGLNYFNRGIDTVIDENFHVLLRRGYELRSYAHEKLNEYDKALEDYKRFKKASDQIIDQEKAKKMTQLEELYELDKKNREITELKSEATLTNMLAEEQKRQIDILRKDNQIQMLQRNTWIGGILLVSLLSFFLYAKRSHRQSLLRLEALVAKRTEELESRNQELETLDSIVRTINREVGTYNIYETLLKGGMTLFPKAEKATLLIWKGEAYGVGASLGYDQKLMTDLSMSQEVMEKIYLADAISLEKGIYLGKGIENAMRVSYGLPTPKSILIMTVESQTTPMSLLVFDNFSSDHAFKESDIVRLSRFHDHAVITMEKTRMLLEIREKTKAIVRTQDQLLMREKMASLGAFTAGVAHEINNPNNFVYGSVQAQEVRLHEFRRFLLALADDDGSDIMRAIDAHFGALFDHVTLIKEGSRRVSAIVSDLRLFSCLDEAERKFVELGTRLRATINLARARFGDAVHFDSDLKGPIELLCWPAELNQALMNMIINACEAAIQAEQSVVIISLNSIDDHAVITIEDNGPGILDDDREKIFDAFYTTKSIGAGTGMGLFTAYSIIRKHNGRIELEQEQKVGASFKIYLPLT